MSGGEASVAAPEDRKLSAVKSWFTRSVSFGGVNGSSTAMAAAAASKGLSEGNGHATGDPGAGDQEAWGGFNITLKQLSMRRTKAGNENGNSFERETALGSPSMTPRNITPLVPLTPLRWKSSPPESGDEHEKSSVPAERSRLGLSVTNSSNVENEEEDDRPRTPFEGFRPTHDDVSSPVESPSAQDPKPSTGEDVMTMTVDFLRSRLLAERSASRVAKERIQELSKKVTELELKLEQVVQEKNKAEKSAEEALLKLLTGDFAQVADCTARAAQDRAAGFNGSNGSGGEEIKEELLSVGDFSRTVSSASSSESKDKADPWVTPKNTFLEPPLKKQEKRAAIESRLRSMWSQISSDMSALVGDGQESSDQMLSWMDQVPAVLQNKPDPSLMLSPPEGTIDDKAHVRARSDASIMLEEYEAHKRVQREWERNYNESKQRQQQQQAATTRRQQQPDPSYLDSKQQQQHSLGTPHRSKSSTDFRHHHPFQDDFGEHRYSNGHHPEYPRHRPAAGDHPHPPHVEHHPQQPLRAQESREWQQEYEDNYGNQPGGVRRQIGYPPDRYGDGGAHLMWDDPRSKARDVDSYRRSRRHRSRSADSSNWPSEEDMRRSMDHHQQYHNYHNSAYPGKTAQNGSLLLRHSYEQDLRSRHHHPHDHYPDAKSNGPGQYDNNKATSDPATLYLAYGPAYDVPREHDKSSHVSDVLLALQKAKAKALQKSTGTNQPRAAGCEPVVVKERVVVERERIRTSNPSAAAAAAGNGQHPSYVEQLNVGKGIDFFF